MKLGEAIPSLFARPTPLLEAGTRILTAGTLLDTPRRDVMLVISKDIRVNGAGRPRPKVDVLKKGESCFVFGGYSLLKSILDTESGEYYKFLFETCERASITTRPVDAKQEMDAIFSRFMRSEFGWALVKDGSKFAAVTLADIIPLYTTGILRTGLSVGEIATRDVLSMPPETRLEDALREMFRRRVRRVFLSGSPNKFTSDREILTFLFSPERLSRVRESPGMLLDATLGEVGTMEAAVVDEDSSAMQAAGLFRPESGAWCLTCPKGLVTPWDLVMKPWKLGRLEIAKAVDKAPVGDALAEVSSLRAFVKDLKQKGYHVKGEGSITGRSGARHHVALIAQRPDEKTIIGVETNGADTALEIVSAFVLALDCGMDACYIGDGEISEENRRLAAYYRMKLLDRRR